MLHVMSCRHDHIHLRPNAVAGMLITRVSTASAQVIWSTALGALPFPPISTDLIIRLASRSTLTSPKWHISSLNEYGMHVCRPLTYALLNLRHLDSQAAPSTSPGPGTLHAPDCLAHLFGRATTSIHHSARHVLDSTNNPRTGSEIHSAPSFRALFPPWSAPSEQQPRRKLLLSRPLRLRCERQRRWRRHLPLGERASFGLGWASGFRG